MSVKRRIVAAFRALAAPSEPVSDESQEPDVPLGANDQLYLAACRGVEWAEKTFPNHSGEWKHHQVSSKLQKIFPTRPKWHVTGAIQRAIEAARQR